jgi:hypothetical protein
VRQNFSDAFSAVLSFDDMIEKKKIAYYTLLVHHIVMWETSLFLKKADEAVKRNQKRHSSKSR